MVATRLASNDLLDKASEHFASNWEPDWERVVREYRRERFFDYENPADLSSNLSEIIVSQELEKFGLRYPGRVTVNGLKEGSSKSFTFWESQGRVFVDSKESRKSLCDVDAVAVFDELPVLFEVKLRYHFHGTNIRVPKTRERAKKEVNHGLHRTMCLHRVQDVLEPIREHHGVDRCGYVIVTYPENFRAPPKNEGAFNRYRRFVFNRGRIFHFYTNRVRYKRDVSDIRERFDI